MLVKPFFLEKHKNDHKLTQIISDFVNFWPQFYPKEHNPKIKIVTIWSLEIKHWCQSNQLSFFITEKWLNLNDLKNQNNLAYFNRIILYFYFVIRTVRIEAISRLRKHFNELTWSGYKKLIRTLKADKWSFDNIYHILFLNNQSYVNEINVRNN